ncbi:MAG: rRNA pseudouridine synthase [Clostridia bacterium]|nr:rRNA pseudouridine synthase [Clostridia bacterium]
MRLDKLLSEVGLCSRTECKKAAKAGRITVDGVAVKSADMHIDPEKNVITYLGQPVEYKKFTYIMLNKPEGYISATDDKKDHTVLELLDERTQKLGLFPCGRLDKNTLGLLILTNDGELCHRLLSPKHHVSKVYYFRAERLITDEDKERLESGVNLDGEMTKPAKLMLYEDRMSGQLTLTEGKFHQVKRMLEAVCNKITYLERVEFAGIPLDTDLKRGEWRELSTDEEAHLRSFLN